MSITEMFTFLWQIIKMLTLFPGNALSCKETFSLLYYEFDAATREPPPWDADRYKLIGELFLFVPSSPRIYLTVSSFASGPINRDTSKSKWKILIFTSAPSHFNYPNAPIPAICLPLRQPFISCFIQEMI